MWKQYMGWIDELLRKIPLEDVIKPPEFPVEYQKLSPGAVIIGKVPPGLRRLYLMFRNCELQYQNLGVKFQVESEIDLGEFCKYAMLERTGNALEALFWVLLRETLQISGLPEQIFVVEYWRVVTQKSTADKFGLKEINEFIIRHINDN